jgi:hypothetical protein
MAERVMDRTPRRARVRAKRSAEQPLLRVGVFSPDPDASWQADCVAALTDVSGVDVVTTFEEGVRPRIPDLDVLLDLSEHGAPPGLVARAGETWRFGYGRWLSRSAVRVAMMDLVAGVGATRVALVREDDGVILRDGWLQTASWSRREQVRSVLDAPIWWPAAVARTRLEEHTRRPSTSRLGPPTVNEDDPATRAPEPARSRGEGLLTALLAQAGRGRELLAAVKAVRSQADWNIAIARVPIQRFVHGETAPLLWLPRRNGSYSADPFGIEQDGVLHVLFEFFDQRSGRGVISHVAVMADGSSSDPEYALDPGVHTSYPYLLTHEDEIYMVPETAEAGEVALYRATDFPRGWRRVSTLIRDVPLSDPTVFEHEGHWWLFGTRRDRGVNHHLFAWHAASLFGPWTPHRQNPIKTDVRSARPGGTPFVMDDVLHRPAQDCTQRYGRRLVINRVEELSPSEFRETPTIGLNPGQRSPYPDGLHTISAAGDATLIDGNGMRFVPEAALHVVIAQLRRFF